MAVRSRQSLVPQISFIVFLDIITAMSGVIILFSMLLGTYLQDGSPLFSGPSPTRSLSKEEALSRALLEEAHNKVLARETEDRLRVGSLSPRELRKRLRNLQSLLTGKEPAEGEKTEEKTIEQIVRENGLQALQTEVMQAETQLKTIQDKIEILRARHNDLDGQLRLAQENGSVHFGQTQGLSLIRDKQDSTKEPVVMELSYAKAKIFPFDQPTQLDITSPASDLVNRMRRHLSGYRPDTHYVFCLVQPSAYEVFRALRSEIRSLGFEVGSEGVAEGARNMLPPEFLLQPKAKEWQSTDPAPFPVEGSR